MLMRTWTRIWSNHERENRRNLKQLPTHRLFWEQQLEAMKLKNVRQVWWDPMMIKRCLSLKLLSPFAYQPLWSSNLLVLPSEWTLRNDTHFIKAKKLDFKLRLIFSYAEIDTIPDRQKFLPLCLMRSRSRKTWCTTLREGGWVCECGWCQ